MKTKSVVCMGPGCASRRIHHEHPHIERGTQFLDVPFDHPGPYFCSIECQAYYYGERNLDMFGNPRKEVNEAIHIPYGAGGHEPEV